MSYLLGVVLFALAIFISVCLHEAGHMVTAKAFGMKVTRYFAGFGPTLFSFRRGETEYGLKGIPLGGFVKIVGMTPQDDDVAPEDEPRAMWRFPLWQRTVVMSAGSITHFVLGFVLLWITLAFVGVPNPALASNTAPAYITVSPCYLPTDTDTSCKTGADPSPAAAAGLKSGDKIIGLNGQTINSYDDLVSMIRSAKANVPTPLTYVRDGQTLTTTVTLRNASRHSADNPDAAPTTVPTLGVTGAAAPGVPNTITYNPISAVGKTVNYTGQTFVGIAQAFGKIPSKVPALWNSLSGKPRDPNTPVSVVGASRLGGETVQSGAWWAFLNILIGLNFFVGVFNLLPLLPLDGGHIAIAQFERVRSWLYPKIGRRDPGRVNYMKMMPVTYAVILVFGGFTLLTVAADIVNPITLFGK